MNRRRKSDPIPAEESGAVLPAADGTPIADAPAPVVEAAAEIPTADGDAAAAEAPAKPRRPRRKRVKPAEPEPEAEEAAELPTDILAPVEPEPDPLLAPVAESTEDPLLAALAEPVTADPLQELLAEPIVADTVLEAALEDDALSAAPLPVENAERLLLELAEKDVVDDGEPIPLLRRASTPDPTAAAAPAHSVPQAAAPVPQEPEAAASYVLVPEAVEESPLPIAEAEEVSAPVRPEPRPEHTGRGGRRRGQEAPRPPRPVIAVPEVSPDLVLVQEALLESVPEDWAEEESVPADTLFDQFSTAPPPSGRRKRRRGRDQGEAPPVPAAPAVGAAPAPITNVMRAEEEAPQRERRDREPKPEQRESRDYKEILINVGERETRIAVMENGRLVELHVEREERVVGGVYKARVSNVLPGMDAAFV
ncbi:MAG: hypothetical protein ACO1SX_08670, partial [Actinomycetota bacterium]